MSTSAFIEFNREEAFVAASEQAARGLPTTVGRRVKQRLAAAALIAALPRHNLSTVDDMTNAYAPDVVFLDIGMPGMDGYEVARRLRRQPGLVKVVLAALTGWGQQEDRRRSAEAGFDHHLVKPPEPKALDSSVADVNLRKE